MNMRPITHGVGLLGIASTLLVCHAETLPVQDHANQSQELTVEMKKLGAFLFSAIKDSREKLRSGIFEASMSDERTRAKRKTFRASAKIFCAFDYNKGLLRYDYEPEAPRQKTRYFRTPEKSVLYTPQTGYLTIMKPDGLAKQSKFRPLDARMVGFASMQEHKSGWTLDRLYKFYTEQAQLTGVRKEANGQFRLILSHSPNKFIVIERHIWIDGAKGYVPVRYQYRYFNRKTKKWSEPLAVTETKWKKQSGIWVPVSLHATSGSKGEAVWTVRFDWKSLNKTVPASLFKRENLKPRPGTLVVDLSLGRAKPVLIEKITEDTDVVAAPESNSWTWIVIAGNLVLLAVVASLFLWFRARGRGK